LWGAVALDAGKPLHQVLDTVADIATKPEVIDALRSKGVARDASVPGNAESGSVAPH